MTAQLPVAEKVPARLPLKAWLPLLIAVTVSIAIFVISELSYREFAETRSELGNGLASRALLLQLEATILDAESAQRGYLLTKREEYLEPYNAALARLRPLQSQLRDQLSDDKAFRDSMAQSSEFVAMKLAEMASTITAAKAGDFDRARAIVDGDEGRSLMNRIRASIVELDAVVGRRVDKQGIEWVQAIETNRRAIFTVVAFNIVLIGIVVLLLIRENRQRNERIRMAVDLAAKLEKEVAARTTELSSLSAFLQTSTEREKAELARELHDELGAILTPAKMDVDYLREQLAGQPGMESRLQRLSQVLDQGIDVKRRIIENLRPSLLDHLGLVAALQWHAQETCRAANLNCKLKLPENFERVPPDLEIAVYRIVQESFTNVIRHAKAKNVHFAIERTDAGMTLSIVDDGEGMDNVDEASMLAHGLTGMRHRAKSVRGRFDVHSAKGKGTSIDVFIPLPYAPLIA
jgi:signal transduction histidine kinase